MQVGTARRANTDDDDEFDYAFDGGKREGATHKQVGGRWEVQDQACLSLQVLQRARRGDGRASCIESYRNWEV